MCKYLLDLIGFNSEPLERQLPLGGSLRQPNEAKYDFVKLHILHRGGHHQDSIISRFFLFDRQYSFFV